MNYDESRTAERRADDHERDRRIAELETALEVLKTKMTPVEAGVANFKSFQKEALKRMGFIQGMAFVWSGVLGIILVVIGFIGREMYPVARAAFIEYYEHHSGAKYEENHGNAVLQYANIKQPQDASISANP